MKHKYSISNIPKPLDNDTLYNYFNLLNKGENIYRNKLILHNLCLVIRTIEIYFDTYYFDADDIFQIGCIGLIKAIDSYKINRNVLFSTYATVCIKNEILMYFNKNNKIIKQFNNEENIIYNFNIPEENYIDNELYNELDKILKNKLSKKEQFIINSYFGINTKKLSQQKIANILNVSQSYLSKLLRQSLNKIKYYLKEENLISEKIYKLK